MPALDAIGLANRQDGASKWIVKSITSRCRNIEGLQVFHAAKQPVGQFARREKSGKQLSRHW
jgi:hypothetical protein